MRHTQPVSRRGETVTYTRYATTVQLTAVRASSRWDVVNPDDGVSMEERSADWLIRADQLNLTPQRGDTITDADGTIFRVMPPGDLDRVFMWHNRNQTIYRIYTKARV